jgi:hypothetical protein
MKRYKIVVQHEVVMYAESEQEAERNLLATPFMKSRTNPRCVYLTEIPLPENETQTPILDERKAPGS